MSVLLSPRRELGEFKKRYKWMALFVVLVFGGLAARLVVLQVVQYERWAAVARENITKTFWLRSTRGNIRDVEGRIVASNRPSYDVYITPRAFLRHERGTANYSLETEEVARFARLMGLSDEQREELGRRILAIPPSRRSHQIEMFSDVTRDQMASLETHELELRGVDVVARPVRYYPYGSLGAHAIGYLNEVSAEDIERLRGQDYRAGDVIGRSGLESSLESILRGQRGFRRVLVDARGRPRENAERLTNVRPETREPVPGRDIVVSLDMELMRSAQRAFRGHPSGAAVVVDVRTGRIRALFSKPSYDLNAITSGLTREAYQAMLADPFRPLIDKTIFETYYPGSTFKPITSLAALQDRIVDPNFAVDCTGRYEVGTQRLRCTQVHGRTDMRLALVQSCNVYFWRIAETVGLEPINRYAREFGLGERTGIGINSESPGFLASREWYEENYGRFRLGYTLNTAIGQGNTRVTLLQLALAYAAMANGGTLYSPGLVERIASPDGTTLEEMRPQVRRQVAIAREHLAYNDVALVGVVNDELGTAHGARIEGGVTVAGKTGTAQVQRSSFPRGVDPQRAWYFSQSHAWFAGYAPAENPELAIVVLVEHGGAGGRNAAPIAVQILQDFLGGEAAAQRARGGQRTE